ncbi:MAG: YggS family pyridoxal phosphate-dependent enzyme [Proteobacteria bacterium]|nr:YggS family pyridoxal phosphate-dependent enzyme [Pseudomonadota bacterium]
MIRVTENLRKIRDLLAKAAIDAGRGGTPIQLLAVSKKQSLAGIIEAADAGQRDFGENFVQEGLEKIASVSRNDLCWHFIGHLQTNKTRAVAEHFDWVHTVDRLKTAQRLSRQRPAELDKLNICLQVNIDGKPGKSGVDVDEVLELAKQVAQLPRLQLRGLMCLPALTNRFEDQRKPFARLRQLAAALAAEGVATDTLSMGMSGDYQAAILEGATIVRIGTAVFGKRKPVLREGDIDE